MPTTVPAVLYVGGYHCQGGSPGLRAAIDGLGGSNIRYMMDRTVMRVTPDNVSTGVPSAASLGCYPWYDGNAGSAQYTVAAAPAPSTTTVTIDGASPGWTINEHVGRKVTFLNTAPIPGVGVLYVTAITANTANTLTFAAVAGAPVAGQVLQVGIGRFNDYHPCMGWLDISEAGTPSSRGGSSWQTSGAGVGPDATLIRYLLENVYTTAPYFAVAKFADPTGPNAGWSDAAPASRALLLAEKARMVTAATARGWTLDWKFVVIDLSPEDLLAAAGTPTYVVTYETALRQMITWVKAQFSSTIQVVLVSHRDDLLATTAALGAPFYRAAHRAIVANTAGVMIADCYDAKPGQPDNSLLDPGVEVTYYTQESYFEMGRRIGDCIRRFKNAYTAPDTTYHGYPVYLMLGDSIFAGQATAAWVTALGSPRISGPTIGSLIRPSNQKIWNAGGLILEAYQPGTNGNTSGSIVATAGPEMELMAYLGELHPDGFALVKRASYSSAMATLATAYSGGNGGRWIKAANQHYTQLQANYAACVTYINQTIGKQVDVRGIFVSLGHNDQTVVGGGAAFEAALRTFVADLTSDFGTRTGGDHAPIIWRQPQDAATGCAGIRDTEVAAVRAALAAVATENPQFLVVDMDALERDKTDNLHETPDSSIEDGALLEAALATVSI